MPIFEYECPKCGIFDVFHMPSERALSFCPTCAKKKRKTKVTKLVSASSFHLKGTGWYKTDYVDAKASASEAEEEKVTKTAKKSSAKKEVATKAKATKPKSKSAKPVAKKPAATKSRKR